MGDDPRLSLSNDTPEARTLFGRRKGKKLRIHQASLVEDVLPSLAMDVSAGSIDPASLFPERPKAVRLEIGFGGAEHLVFEAARQREIGFIGCEPFVNGVAKLLVQIEEQGLTNVRVHHGDARQVLERLPTGSIDRVDVLYPDPWPKWRQRKRRFLSLENIQEITRVLRPGGEFRFATDIDDYAGWVLARILKTHGLAWREAVARNWCEPWPLWPSTRYEAKAFREGRPPVYLTFVRDADNDSVGSAPNR
ncbi:MAG: tRNA ((46)-N7)-methyltransferase TrmB [Hyphomicrobiales bacterium]|nr:tRNA ((46)-N7)-methyltransferase TrmB [Hyphomicrobiales bacterium]